MYQHRESCFSEAIALYAELFAEDGRINCIIELHEIPEALESVELKAPEDIDEDLPVLHDV